MNSQNASKAAKHRPWLPTGVLLAGLALTLFAGYYAWRTVHLRNRAEFDRTAQHARADINRSLQTYIAVLRGLAGFFAAETNVTHKTFSAYVERLRVGVNYPGVQGFGFSLKTTPDRLSQVRSRMMEQGFPDFQVWPDTPRDEYHTIIFLEPDTPRNRAALGYDMFSDPVRREAMEQARDTGHRTASGKVTLVQEIEGPKQPGFLIYTPVYFGGKIPPSMSERREKLHGFVYSPFRMGDLIHTVLGEEFLSTVDILIYDGGTASEQSLMFSSTVARQKSPGFLETVHSASLSLDVAGRTWLAVLSTPPRRMNGWWIAPTILGTGLALSAVLFYVTSAERRARRRVEAFAVQLQASESALRDSETRFRLIVENARDFAIFSMDLHGQVISWNTGAERMFGFNEAEIIGKSASIIFTPEDNLVGAPEQELKTALSKGIASDDRWHQGKNGSRVFVSGIVRLMKDESGQPVGFLKIARDVTERLEAEARIKQEKELSEKIINSLPGVFYLFDQAGVWLRWNENLQEITGTTASELANRHPIHFFRGRDCEKVAEAIKRVIEEGQATVEADLIDKEGRPMPHLFYGRRILTEGKICVMGMGVDISERKRAEDELRLAQEQLRIYTVELERRVGERTADLRQSLRSLEDLLYHVAHDLRAPLRSMASFTNILLEDYAPRLDERAQDYAKRISNSAQFMDELVQDLLDYGHLSHSQVTLTVVNLERQVDSVLDQFSSQLKGKHAQVEVLRPLPPVKGSPAIVSQIILNLVDNALKFVPPDRDAHLRIWADVDGAVRLWVEDNGIGIRPEYHGRIFRLFERLHGGNQFPGTGIGLAIVAKGAERLGGAAGVESVPGKGSRFWVELPAARSQQAEPLPDSA